MSDGIQHYATVIRETREVSSIANLDFVNFKGTEPPWLDERQRKVFAIVPVGSDARVGDILTASDMKREHRMADA